MARLTSAIVCAAASLAVSLPFLSISYTAGISFSYSALLARIGESSSCMMLLRNFLKAIAAQNRPAEGLTEREKELVLTLLRNAAYASSEMQTIYDRLKAAWKQ